MEILCVDQIGARPPEFSEIIRWRDGVSCTLRTLMIERFRTKFEFSFANVHARPLMKRRVAKFEKLLSQALEDFNKRALLAIVEDRMIFDLDEAIKFTPQTRVLFLRLPALVGG